MAIDSVSSAVSATVQAPPQNREARQAEARAAEAAQAQRTEPRRPERQEPPAQQAAEARAAPVVNTQGQMTGTRINTTA